MALARAHPFDPDAPAAAKRPLAQPRFAPGRPFDARGHAAPAYCTHPAPINAGVRSQEVFPEWE